jgi:hypothetical protein
MALPDHLPGIAWCHADPFILDTDTKVAWANDVRAQLGGRALHHPPWRLGDCCWYKPAPEWIQTHNICLDCWCAQEEDPDGLNLNLSSEEAPEDICCWCGKRTSSGIYKRADLEETRCNGNHREEGDFFGFFIGSAARA